jgi:hypothetical protein
VLLTRIDRPNDKEPFEGWSIEQYKAEGGKLGARKDARLEAAAEDSVEDGDGGPKGDVAAEQVA